MPRAGIGRARQRGRTKGRWFGRGFAFLGGRAPAVVAEARAAGSPPQRRLGLRAKGVRGAFIGLAAALLAALAAPSTARAAEPLPKPAGTVLLTVSGHIERGNDDKTARFDLGMLSKLGVKTVRTSTPWTDGAHVFEGVLVRDLLVDVGAVGSMVRARGLNDFFVDIPLSDFTRYSVLVAFKMDGQNLQVRDGGPLWIVYPRDGFPELAGPVMSARSIWQLVAIDVR